MSRHEGHQFYLDRNMRVQRQCMWDWNVGNSAKLSSFYKQHVQISLIQLAYKHAGEFSTAGLPNTGKQGIHSRTCHLILRFNVKMDHLPQQPRSMCKLQFIPQEE